MSDYQFMKYSEKRKAEIEQNKSKGKSKPKRRTAGGEADNSELQGGEVKSSYRAYSKCTVVLPSQRYSKTLYWRDFT